MTELGSLLDLMLERRRHQYDPWVDLAQRAGVELVWMTGEVKSFGRPKGLTSFTDLRIQLRLGMDAQRLRSTLGHELFHLERGGVIPSRTEREEERVELLAAKRLIDPVLFDALVDKLGGMRKRDRPAFTSVLNCDHWMIEKYGRWRTGVTKATAVRAWDKRHDPVQWPPRWLIEQPDTYLTAARFAGVVSD